MDTKINEFIKDWKNVRGKTIEFLEAVPQERMTWKPHDLLGTFGMQIRHVIKSQEAYLNGMKIGRIDFSEKDFDSELEKNKQKALMRLKQIDEELINFLAQADEKRQIIFADGVFGEHAVSLTTALGYLMDHEIYHQGMFTCYGRLAGLGKFRFM